MDSTGEATVDDAVTWLRRRGRADGGGERVTQRTHTLQTARQAEQPDCWYYHERGRIPARYRARPAQSGAGLCHTRHRRSPGILGAS
jgi:predicted HD phosphohydrolase